MLSKLSLLGLAFIILIHSLVLTKLIYFPYPELFIYPYLTNSGLKPYQQILDQHFPGLLFLPVNFDNLGLTTPETARGWSIGIIIINQILLFVIGKKLLGSPARALMVNFLYLIWQPFFEGWVLWIDSFLPLLLLPAFYLLLGEKGDKGNTEDKGDRGIFWAGIFLGLGIVFKQVLIPLVGFVAVYIVLNEKRLKPLLIFLLGSFIPLFFMIIYLAGIGVLGDFWYWTVVFNLTTYAQFGRGLGPTTAHFTRVLFVFGLALMFLALDIFKRRQSQFLLIFLVGTLLGLSTRFDFVHFQPALPFAVLATVYGFGKLGGLGRFGVIGVYGLVVIWWSIIFYKGHLGDRVISFDPHTLRLAEKIKSYTTPKEKIFIFGEALHLYQLSNTLPAGDIFAFQFSWFMEHAKDRILDGIKIDRPNIIVSNRSTVFEGERLSDFAKDIDSYINQNYSEVDKVGDTKILRRNTY